MTSGDPLSPQARRLRQALERLGLALNPDALEEAVRATLQAPQPLGELGAALRRGGLEVEPGALAAVAWGLLGISRPGGVRLGASADARLTHLAELHDVTLPSAARTLATRLAGESHLAPDLRRVRPGLAAVKGAAELLEAIYRAEGAGFLVLPGEFGPWAYVPSVADLQELLRAYGVLVRAASASREEDVLTAALHLQGRAPPDSVPLLARLEATDYRQPARSPGTSPAVLVALEDACWSAAEHIAWGQQARQARR